MRECSGGHGSKYGGFIEWYFWGRKYYSRGEFLKSRPPGEHGKPRGSSETKSC